MGCFMKKVLDIQRGAVVRLCGLMLLIACGWAAGTEQPPGAEPLPWKDGMKVHELLYLDTQLALQLAREKQRVAGGGKLSAAPGAVASASPDPELHLIAIYGVGTKLLAEVRHAGKSVVYMNGRSKALGSQEGDTATYRLSGISGRCVRLEREGQGNTLCLPLPSGLVAP